MLAEMLEERGPDPVKCLTTFHCKRAESPAVNNQGLSSRPGLIDLDPVHRRAQAGGT